MGRKVQKVKGALVYMGRRRTKGVGVIIDKTPVPTRQMTIEEKDSYTPSIVSFYEVNNVDEVCALVHWLKRPSEWEMERSGRSRSWVPLSWLRLYKKSNNIGEEK